MRLFLTRLVTCCQTISTFPARLPPMGAERHLLKVEQCAASDTWFLSLTAEKEAKFKNKMERKGALSFAVADKS